MNKRHDFSASFLRMDPETGDIECYVPAEPEFGELVSEGEGSWRLATAAESVQSWILTEPLPLHYEEDVGTEFDAEFEGSVAISAGA